MQFMKYVMVPLIGEKKHVARDFVQSQKLPLVARDTTLLLLLPVCCPRMRILRLQCRNLASRYLFVDNCSHLGMVDVQWFWENHDKFCPRLPVELCEDDCFRLLEDVALVQRVRKLAMRCRPYVVRSEFDGTEVLYAGSPVALQTPPPSRRSLAAIQLEAQGALAVHGGFLLPARRCRRCRFRMKGRKSIRVTFNPRIPGECLRAVSTQCLRSYLKDLLEKEDPERVQQCAKQFGMSTSSYISSTTRGRWGTSLDVAVLAPALNMAVILLDCENGRVLFESGEDRKKVTICYRNKHFTLGKVKATVVSKMRARTKLHKSQVVACRGGAGDGKDGSVSKPALVRRYPFAKQEPRQESAATASNAEQSKKKKKEQGSVATSSTERHTRAAQEAQTPCKTESMTVSPHIDLIFHGSFAPFHMGHYQTAKSAAKFFEKRNMIVDTIHVGFTTARQLRRKLGDTKFLDDELRAKIIRCVLRDLRDQQMQVDSASAGSATELEERHVDATTKRCVHILGSDIQKRPSPSSIVVLRTFDDISNNPEYFDIRQWKAVCAQQGHLGLSATQVREDLDRGVVHASYGPEAKAALEELGEAPLGQMVEADEEVDTQPKPKSKAMPKRTSAPKQIARQQSTVVLTPAPATEQSLPSQGPPSQPEQAQLPGERTLNLTALEIEIMTRSTTATGEPKILPSARRDLSKAGVMKLAGPRVLNLSTYWEHCIVPLGQLLRVTPYSISRRSGDGEV
eukprot:6128694-Amphidinium_carterae.1